MKRKRMPLTAIVKPTKGCNLGCDYCYEGETNNERMGYEILSKVIKEVTGYNEAVCNEEGYKEKVTEFMWHGGEPLLMGKEFYKIVRNMQKKCGENYQNHRIINSIQSNITLLSPELWKFFKEEEFFVGSSLDGYKELHNAHRTYKNGKGTFDRVMESINIARPTKRGISDISVIVTLTKDKLNKIPQIYNFFKENRIEFDINYPCITGNAKGRNKELEISPQDWGRGVTELFDIWFFDKTEPFVKISELAKYSAAIIEGSTPSCRFSGDCRARYISVNPNGDVYPCGKFGSCGDFKLGNIYHESLNKIMESDAQEYLLQRDSNNISECGKCKYKCICNSGCMFNAYLTTGDILKKDPLCEGYKRIYSHIEDILKRELNNKAKEIESKICK